MRFHNHKYKKLVIGLYNELNLSLKGGNLLMGIAFNNTYSTT